MILWRLSPLRYGGEILGGEGMPFEPGIKIFADASSVQEIHDFAPEAWVAGFTTNPTLLKKGGVTDYKQFAMEAVVAAQLKPLSLEVVADDLETMENQGRVLGLLGSNVVVKIPITTTRGESCLPVVRSLLDAGVGVNVTAVMTDDQVSAVVESLAPTDAIIVSVFAGRIADSGVDPVPVMRRYVEWLASVPRAEVLWASPREVLNIVQAEDCGCDIITVTPELLRKVESLGKDLNQFSLETVRMFHEDALSSEFQIEHGP